ncbi:RluA family pseudouridine synthase [Tengunoibacter tsumagoiensis]|uniref:RNA pseudouridylate synthase n=1 Tax=Tengunoibacter tsumagoiensis TaxID=2014871 RepID=A0A402A251_9CHLR|nr:RNA pseudouridine synthase [Tengunoibacter tsumagoiensis]GCE13135.1 hypothetical protein KTT_29940 [Tengunoibacter tsumagoiensis]
MEIADISLLFQDHYLLLVNKPAGIVIHPTYKHAAGTLWDALLEYLQQQVPDDWQPPVRPDDPEWEGAPAEIREMLRAKRTARYWQEDGLLPRPCLVHRLDKDTSGIVALARTENSRRHLVKQFQEHTIRKSYLAVIQAGADSWALPRVPLHIIKRSSSGEVIETLNAFDALPELGVEYLLDGPLQRDPDDRRRCIVGPDGQEAQTIIRGIAVDNGYALLEVHPITGRTHQIRAHLAATGYAIVGDQTYAPMVRLQAEGGLQRQFLHAYSITLHRYPGNELTTYRAPLATDLLLWLEQTSPTLYRAWLNFFNS